MACPRSFSPVPSTRHTVRPARPSDADGIGGLHVRIWREAYAAHMPADYLRGLDPAQSARTWRLRLEVEETTARVVVAHDATGEMVGFAAAGEPMEQPAGSPAVPDWQLYAINVVATEYGSGVSDLLMEEAVGQRAALLWVLRDNARARSFYRRHGFAPDGASMVHDETGAMEVRLVRDRREVTSSR